MGPTFFLHLRRTDVEPDDLDAWLRERVEVSSRTGSSWEFWPADDTCQCSLSLIPFGSEAAGNGTATEPYLNAQDQDAYANALGFRPKVSFQFDNYCRSDEKGHRLLAVLAADLADHYGGFVALGEESLTYLQSLESAGTVLPVTVAGVRGTLVDGAVMRAWARSSAFFLTK
jgi:hypothetical protein